MIPQFFGFWGGSKLLYIVVVVCVFGLGSRRTFFLYMDPLTPGAQL